MNKQFTASEVRAAIAGFSGYSATHHGIGGNLIAMLNAYADRLEADEKAVPVAIVSEGVRVDGATLYAGSLQWLVGAELRKPGTKLYTHPAPADAERLAEALRNARGFVLHFGDEPARMCIAEIDAALAAHSAQAQPPAASVPDAITIAAEISTRPEFSRYETPLILDIVKAVLAAQENPSG